MEKTAKNAAEKREEELRRIVKIAKDHLTDENVHRLYVTVMALWSAQE